MASRVPDQSAAAATLVVACSPAVGAASPMSDGSTWPGRPALGVSSQITPPSRERAQRVDERVDQVAVAVAPPQQDRVHDVVVVLVDQGAARRLLDRDPQGVVAVLVPPELLDHLALLERQPGGQLSVLLRGVRGRAHEQVPSRRAWPGARLVWRVVHRERATPVQVLPDSEVGRVARPGRSPGRTAALGRGHNVERDVSARPLPLINAGLPTQLVDVDPEETQEWRESLDEVIDRAGPVPRSLPHAEPAAAGQGAGGRRPVPDHDRLHQHHPARAASRCSPATSGSSGGSARTSAGTPRSWSTGRSVPASASAATSPPTPPRRRCTRSASTTSSAARTTRAAATRSTSRATPPPACTRAPILEGRLTEHQLDGFRQELSHAGGGLSVLPAPAAHAGLLGVPDGVDGPRPAQRDLPGAVQQVPARARHQGHQRPARVGVPRRRRDGRGRVGRRDRAGRPRGARQPHVRRQLQPAAARRPGARQRQDHPGARGDRSAAPAGTSSRWCGAAAGTRCWPPTPTARSSTS